MNPSVQDRLDSCVRALEHVILPALPESAALAREQAMLVMGQVQIIRAQLDATPAFEAEEARDIEAIAHSLLDATHEEASELRTALDDSGDATPRERTAALQNAIDSFLRGYDAAGGPPAEIARIVCEHGARRAGKDRAWFAAMGFDQGFAG